MKDVIENTFGHFRTDDSKGSARAFWQTRPTGDTSQRVWALRPFDARLNAAAQRFVSGSEQILATTPKGSSRPVPVMIAGARPCDIESTTVHPFPAINYAGTGFLAGAHVNSENSAALFNVDYRTGMGSLFSTGTCLVAAAADAGSST
jgi:hypothetical protein